MTFTRRRIEATITLGKGVFGDTKGDTVKLSGLRMAAHMNNYGQDSMGQIQLRIFGLTLDMVKRLTSVGPIANTMRGQNRLVVAAGDSDAKQLATIFEGNIDQAWGEFSAAPDVALNISGLAGFKDALTPVPPLSFPGAVDAADVLAGLAKTMGLAFENNGVSVQLAKPYYPGTALEQLRRCAKEADVRYNIDCGTLAVWPRLGARKGQAIKMSSATGMVGYPGFTASGVSVTSIFTPTAKQGGRVEMESTLTPANGVWNILSVVHDLESETPGGRWFTQIECGKVAAV